MRFEEARRRLMTLPDPLPAGPHALDPVAIVEPGEVPPWARRPAGEPPRDAAVLVLIYPGADREAHLVLI